MEEEGETHKDVIMSLNAEENNYDHDTAVAATAAAPALVVDDDNDNDNDNDSSTMPFHMAVGEEEEGTERVAIEEKEEKGEEDYKKENNLELLKAKNVATSRARCTDARDDHGRALRAVTQLENALSTARINAVISNNQLTAHNTAVAVSRRALNGQWIRTEAMHTANTAYVLQYLDERGAQELADGDRSLTRRVVEVTANALDFPQWHTKSRRCHRIREDLSVRDRTIGPAFDHLVTMRVLVMRRAMTGAGYEYGLADYFANLLPQPPRFDVPEPVDRQMYPALNETSSEESANEDE